MTPRQPRSPRRREWTVVAGERPRAGGDERRVAEAQSRRGCLEAARRGDATPPAGLDAVLDREHAGDELGRSEVAVALAGDVCLAQSAVRPGAPHDARVDALLLDRDELVGDGVE